MSCVVTHLISKGLEIGNCDACTSSKEQRWYGVYDATCPACCARLVISARPNKRFQEAMLAAIAMQKGAPEREQILEHIKGKQSD